jgi:hypothetical protein
VLDVRGSELLTPCLQNRFYELLKSMEFCCFQVISNEPVVGSYLKAVGTLRSSSEFCHGQQAKETLYRHRSSSKADDALSLPARKQPADGKHRKRSHLRQLLLRKVDLHNIIHALAYLRKQTN